MGRKYGGEVRNFLTYGLEPVKKFGYQKNGNGTKPQWKIHKPGLVRRLRSSWIREPVSALNGASRMMRTKIILEKR